MLFIDPNVAKNYVEPLGQAKFDKAVGNMVSSSCISHLQCRIGCSEYHVHSYDCKLLRLFGLLMNVADDSRHRGVYA